MKVLITGAGGQLATELMATVPPGFEATACRRADLDISRADMTRAVIADLAPALVINAAAYTAVDKAESEPQAAWAINADGVENLARSALRQGARLIHISTDFVFDGSSRLPYRPEDKTAPLGVYGASKLAGEQRLKELPGLQALIIRSAWIYSVNGHNFVKTMLRLMQERNSLNVVSDQYGSPTWARDLALAIWAAAQRESLQGIYHWSNRGAISWHEFAVAIQEEALAAGLLARPVAVHAIPSSEYPTPARRPAYSVLDCASAERDFGRPVMPWRDALRAMLKQLAASA